MKEMFDAIPMTSKSWGITDEGVIYGDVLHPYDTIKKISQFAQPTIITNGVVQVELKNSKIFNLVYKKPNKERADKAIAFATNILKNFDISSKPGVIYSLNGARGRHMDVYEDRVCITTEVTLGSLFTSNVTDGAKEIYYSDVISVQAKAPSLTLGYIQLETASVMMNNGADNFFNENTFTYNESDLPNGLDNEVVQFIKNKVAEYKKSKNAPVVSQLSAADELKKFKELLDMGVITEEEFKTKKKELLGL